MNVLAVSERNGGGWHAMSYEAIAAARRIADETGGTVTVLVIGEGTTEAAAGIAMQPVDAVLTADSPALAKYSPDSYAAVVRAAVGAGTYSAVVFPHTYQVRDYGPKAATVSERPFVSDVIGLRVEGGELVFVRQMFQGKLNADVTAPAGAPYFVSVQSGAFPALAGSGAAAPVSSLALDTLDLRSRTQAEEPFRESAGEVDLSKAKLIVSVGRGIKEPENIRIAEELAAALGAELAASRPICDAGWLPLERQVGSSGQTVSPDAYIALGISGAIQHVVGMKGAKTIVAINTDASAPIFEIADYGIVGDLFEVVPAITKRLRGG